MDGNRAAPQITEINPDELNAMRQNIEKVAQEQFVEQRQAEEQAKENIKNEKESQAKQQQEKDLQKLLIRLKKKVLFQALGSKLGNEATRVSLDGLKTHDVTEILSKLQNDNLKQLTPELYAKLIEAFKKRKVSDIKKILDNRSGNTASTVNRSLVDSKTGQKIENPDSKLVELAKNEHSLVKALAKQSSRTLTQQLYSRNSEIAELEEKQEKSAITDEEKLLLNSLKYEQWAFSEAIIKRQFDNYRLFDVFRIHNTGSGDALTPLRKLTQLAENDQEAAEANELLEKTSGLIDKLNIGNDSNINFEEITDQLEDIRLLLDKFKDKLELSQLETKDGRLTELLTKKNKADTHEKLKQVVALMPKTEFARIKTKAETGDETALNIFIKKVQDETESGWKKRIDEIISRKRDTGNSADYLDQIQNLLQKPNLEVDEKLELFSLLGTIDLDIQIAELKISWDESSKQISEENQNVLSEILEDNKIHGIEELEEQYYDSNKPTESGHNLAESLIAVKELTMLDIDQNLYQSSEEVRAHMAKLMIIRDMVRTGRLDMTMVREKFNIVGLPGLDITTKDGERQLLVYISEKLDLGEELIKSHDEYIEQNETFSDYAQSLADGKTKQIFQAINAARLEGPAGLRAWLNEQRSHATSEPEKENLKKIADMIEEGLTYPYQYFIKDVNSESKTTAHSENSRLFEEIKQLMDKQKEIDEFWEKQASEKELPKLQNHMLGNLMYNNFLRQFREQNPNIATKEIETNIKTIFENTSNTGNSKDYIGQLINRLEQQSNSEPQANSIQQIIAQLKGVNETLQTKYPDGNYTDKIFTLEKGPAGIFIRIYNQGMMRWLTGITDAEFNDVQGITLDQKNLLQYKPNSNEQGQNFPGYIAIINQNSEAHEKLHVIEKSIESMLQSTQEKDYFKFGIDEIVANLMNANYSEAINGMQNLSSMNLTLSKDEIGEIESAQEEDKQNKLKEIIEREENNNKRKAFVILKLVKDIINNKAFEGNEIDRDEAQSLVTAILTENGNDLDRIIYSLMRTFHQDNIGNMNLAERQDVLGKYKNEQELQENLWKNLEAKYVGEDPTKIFGEIGNIDEFLKNQKKIAIAGEIMKFMRFVDSAGNEDTFGASSPDPLGFTNVWGGYRDKFGRELKRDINTMDTLFGNMEDSYFSERTAFRMLHLPFASKSMPIRAAEGMINGFIDKALIRSVYPLNTRDFRLAWAGTPIGNYLGISKFRGSSPAARYGFLSPIWGKTSEEWFKAHRGGAVERGRYEGHVVPSYLRNLSVDEQHFALVNVVQSRLSREIAGSQIMALLEKEDFATLNVVPGDRPGFNESVDEEKAGQISDFALQRIKAESLNFNIPFADQAAISNYGDYLPFGIKDKLGGKVIVDESGTMFIEDAKTKERIELDSAVLEKRFGWDVLKTGAGKDFYGKWRPKIVKYDGEEFFVHVDPRDGIPKLYKQEWINWADPKSIPPEAKKVNILDKNGKKVEGKYYVPADVCEFIQNRGYDSGRHRMDLNIGIIGLYKQIMETREKQRKFYEEKGKHYHEEDLYNLQDLIRSVNTYLDPYAGPIDNIDKPDERKFVRELTVAGFDGKAESKKTVRQIFIPSFNGDPENEVMVDYEIAKELLMRLEKLEVRDNILRQGWVKGNPESIMYDEQVPMNRKLRMTIGHYFQMLADDDMEYFSRKISAVPDPTKGEIKRYTVAEISIPTITDPQMLEFLNTPEGTAKRLEYLKSQKSPDAEEIKKLEIRMKKFIEFDEYEKLLYYGQYGLFKNTDPDERAEMRNGIRKFIRTQIDPAVITAAQTELTGKNELIDTTGMSAIDQMQAEAENQRRIWEFLLHDDKLGSAGGRGVHDKATLGAYMIDKFFRSTNNFYDVEHGLDLTIGRLEPRYAVIKTLHSLGLEADNGMIDMEELYNANNDRRPMERFMAAKDEASRVAIASDLMGNIQDRDKYRQEMKDWTLRVMQLADFHANEFNRYRRAKYFWDSMAKNCRRLNTVVFMGGLASLVLVSSPVILPLLLANIGIAKTLLPYLDMKHAVSVNRRNVAREIARKMRSEANHVIEMFEKGGTLTDNIRKDLEDLELEYNIMGESIQGKFKPEGWHANKNFIIDSIVESLMGEQGGLIPANLAA